MLGPAAHQVYVQWPELAARVPRAHFCGRLPWEGDGRARSGPTGAQRTLITVGTSRLFPFDRLVGVADLVEGEVVVQRGPSRLRPDAATVADFMSFDELNAEMEAADAVVTHAGIGSVLLAITHGHRPVVMARRPDLAEGVDAHQVEFARRLQAQGLATVVDDPADVVPALRSILGGAPIAAAPAQPNELLARLGQEIGAALRGEPCGTW
jgi:UDP-N-acetylglucosamine transferase subunit ALG13